MSPEADNRSALLAAKLSAVVRAHWDQVSPTATAGAFPEGATLVEPNGGRSWVYVEKGGHRRVGSALAFADKASSNELHLIVDSDSADIAARRASFFVNDVQVWSLDGAELSRVETPSEMANVASLAPGAELYRPVLAQAGLEPIAEGGELIGELRGLEVARVVVDDHGEAHVEAGVGRFDREIAAMMFAHLSETDSLARAIEMVAEYRTPGAATHPLNQLVPERWLRTVLISRPELVGATELHSVGSAIPRLSLREVGVASALGTSIAGEAMVVTCSTGVDLEVIASAADDRAAHSPSAELVIAIPAKDIVGPTSRLAARLKSPARIVEIHDDWRDLDMRES